MKIPEGLLLVGAVSLPFIFRLSSYDIHLKDTYFVINTTLSNICFSLILVLQFILHIVLVKKNLRIVSIAWIHVVLTLLSMTLFLYFTYLNNAAIMDSDNFNSIGRFFQQFVSLQLWMLMIFGLLQLLFIIYFIVRIFGSDPDR